MMAATPSARPDGEGHSFWQYRVRAIAASDAALLQRFGEALSTHSRHQRFFSPRGFMPGEVGRLTSFDPQREAALIAIMGRGCATVMVGVARYVIDLETREAELAIVVADQWQGHGVGVELLKQLMIDARDRGVGTLTGAVLATNQTMQRLALRLGFSLSRVAGDSSLIQIRREILPGHEPAPRHG